MALRSLLAYPTAERTRLAYIRPDKPDAFQNVAGLLRLTALEPTAGTQVGDISSVSDLLVLWQKASPILQLHTPCFQDVPSPLDTDWLLPGRSPLVPFTHLPQKYVELLGSINRMSCFACSQEPREPALCLLCGAFMCMDSDTCRGRDANEGQCTDHARNCGAGDGLFLLPYSGLVLAVSAPKCCFWDCPYVDRNGEPNPLLKRPCALQFNLDERRLVSLRQTYTTAAVQREIIKHNEKTGRYIRRAM